MVSLLKAGFFRKIPKQPWKGSVLANKLTVCLRITSMFPEVATHHHVSQCSSVSSIRWYSTELANNTVSLHTVSSSTDNGANNPDDVTVALPFWIKGLSFGLGVLLAGYGLLRKEEQKMKDTETISPLYHMTKYIFGTAQCGSSDTDVPSKRYNFLAEAVEIASPSVVYIERSQRVATIFGEMVGVSSGSGFIVHDGRYVLTNAHVVANSRSVEVKISTGRVIHGEVTDVDQVADLALIKLDLPQNESLPAVTFGSSSTIRPGEWVVALGSPLNLTNTITAGIVSSVLRPSKELGLEHHKPDMEYVQTDAPITHGNSGGPLVNLDGKVIGVNTMTAGPGISFAIPSDFAQNFVEKATKTIQKRPQTKYAIGVSMLSINPSIIRVILQRISLPQDVTHGVFLANVWPNSPAAQAGLRTGDVIVRINGKNIFTSKDVNKIVQTGARLNMEVVRKSKWINVTVVPEPFHSDD